MTRDTITESGYDNGGLSIRLHSTNKPFCLLTTKVGYAWDGPSGLGVPDLAPLMRASLAHDALYQLIREGVLPLEAKDPADRLFGEICAEDGVWRWVTKLFVLALKTPFGHAALRNGKDLWRIE